MSSEDFLKTFFEVTNFKENPYHPLVWINGDPKIGDNVYISGFSEIYAKGASVIIGDYCDIASFVAINCSDSHKYTIGIEDNVQRGDITLEDHVYVGTHSFIGGGTYIGHHSVIGAGTIVPPGVYPPYSLIVGNPAIVKEGYYLKKKFKTISHNKLSIGLEEQKAAEKVIKSGYLAQGSEVKEFENEMCDFLDIHRGHAVAVSSGSAAISLALQALNEKRKIEKIYYPAYSCVAVQNAAKSMGVDIEALDCDDESPNIKSINKDNINTAIIACHMFGFPMRLEGSNVIEDCAQAIGAEIDGVKVGTQTGFGIFSFYATKPITSGGQGGMIIAKDLNDIAILKDLRDFDMKNDGKRRFNFQMTDLQASIGREQLKKLPQFIKIRKELAQRYIENGIDLWQPVSGGNWYRGIIESNNPRRLINYLSKYGISAIIPIEEFEILGNKETMINSLNLTKKLVSIPLYPKLTFDEQDIVISALKQYKLIYGSF